MQVVFFVLRISRLRCVCRAWSGLSIVGTIRRVWRWWRPGMDRVRVRKKAGRLSNLVADIESDPLPEATVAIGPYTLGDERCANDVNAHPHSSMDGRGRDHP